MSHTPTLDPIKDFEFVRAMLGEIRGQAYGKRQSEHAAALISAINTHDALVKALHSLLDRSEQLDQSATHDGLQNCEAIAKARKVLALAEGKESVK